MPEISTPAAEPQAPEAPQAPQAPGDAFDGAQQARTERRDQGDTFEAGPSQTQPTKDSWQRPEMPPGISTDNYSPDLPGWHDYSVTNTVAPADMKVTPEEMRDYMSRHAYPGQDPSKPVENGQKSTVYDPRTGMWGGPIRTEVSNDGLTISNFTRPGHPLHDGRIIRTAQQQPDGSWTVTTRGYGNNLIPGMNKVNDWQGPKIFKAVDEQMAANIRAHHAQ